MSNVPVQLLAKVLRANTKVNMNSEYSVSSVSVNDWINAFVCSYDSGQVVLSFGRKQSNNFHDDRRRLFNSLISPVLHSFNPQSKEMIDCKTYTTTCNNYGIIFNSNFQIVHNTKLKSHPYKDLTYFPVLAANKVAWNPNKNSFLTLATGFHSGFIIVNKIILPKTDTCELKECISELTPNNS